MGKILGIFVTLYLVARITRASLNADLRWVDVLGVSSLAGVGFAVSLLSGELAFGIGSERGEHLRVGVLAGSFLGAVTAAAILRVHNCAYRALAQSEKRDSNFDEIPTYTTLTTHHAVSDAGPAQTVRRARSSLKRSESRCKLWTTPTSA